MRITHLFRSLVLGCVVGFAACSSGDAPPDETGDSFLADSAEDGTDLISVMNTQGDFMVFTTGVDAAGLGGELRGSGPFTLFAPPDSALNAVSGAVRDDSVRFGRLLQSHVVPGRLTAADLREMTSVTTLLGTTIPVRADGDLLRVGDAVVVLPDVDAANGIIHVLAGSVTGG